MSSSPHPLSLPLFLVLSLLILILIVILIAIGPDITIKSRNKGSIQRNFACSELVEGDYFDISTIGHMP